MKYSSLIYYGLPQKVARRSCLFQNVIVSQLTDYTEPEISLPHSHGPTTGPYPEPV
jgi:hypothetical protein